MIEKDTDEIDERAHYEAISRRSRVYVTACSHGDTERENSKSAIPLILMHLLYDTLRKKRR